MKNIKTLKLAIISTLLFSVILTLYAFNNPESDIVGTWVHENDSENIWQFTNNGTCKWLNPDNTVNESFTYTISYSSPHCGYQVKENGTQFSYLKMTDSEGDEYCYEIQVDNETLSINYLGTSQYDLFNKQ